MDNQKTSFPQLIIRPQSPQEEMDYLWSILKRMSFFREHGYSVEIPDHQEFKKLAQISLDFNVADKETVKNIFIKECYDSSFYNAGIAVLEAEKPNIKKIFPILLEFNRKWGFKIFPQYVIALTRYGPGGSYDASSGKVIMMTTRDGKFKKSYPAHTPAHEMIHIGIEENIVKRFRLTHEEKERLVDLIILNKFCNLLQEYRSQQIGNSKIDQYITNQTLDDLPSAIKRYVDKWHQ